VICRLLPAASWLGQSHLTRIQRFIRLLIQLKGPYYANPNTSRFMAGRTESTCLGHENTNRTFDHFHIGLFCVPGILLFLQAYGVAIFQLPGTSLVRGTSMPVNPQNPLGQPPGKIVTRVEKFQTLSGQLVLIRWMEVSVMDSGVLRKEETFEVLPPLADGRIPDRIADIRECCIRLGLYHHENVSSCPVCGRHFCRICAGLIKVKESETLACKVCADEASAGFLRRVFKYFWNLKG